MKHNWLVTVVTDKNEQRTFRVRAGNDLGARVKVSNEHPEVKVIQVRQDGP
jgi:hypothetical protein